MVKLRGPLLSLQGSGSIGKVATYSNWKGRAYAKQYKEPTNNQQITQLGIRAALGWLATAWGELTSDDHDAWEEFAARANVTQFDSYIGWNLSRFANGEGLETRPDSAFAANTINVVTQMPIASRNLVTWNAAAPPPIVPWAFLAWASQTSGFTPAPTNAIALANGATLPGNTDLTFKPPSRGTWYLRVGSTRTNGEMFITATQSSVDF